MKSVLKALLFLCLPILENQNSLFCRYSDLEKIQKMLFGETEYNKKELHYKAWRKGDSKGTF